GDNGLTPEWPSAGPNVLSVGGTHLVLNSSFARQSESTWGDGTTGDEGAGGGCSPFEPAAAYQHGFAKMCAGRATPDVGLDADPNTVVFVYNSAYDPAHIYEIGGTSLACPMMAGIVADINANRAGMGKQPLGVVNTDIYSSAVFGYSTHFFDVVTGTNGASALRGYDLGTGVGVPLGVGLNTVLSSLP